MRTTVALAGSLTLKVWKRGQTNNDFSGIAKSGVEQTTNAMPQPLG